MSEVVFLPGSSIVTIWLDVLDPYYADMDEGESWWTGDKAMRLTLPIKQWPKPVAGAAKVVTRWRYEDAVSPAGLRGKRITKVPSTAAG